MKYKAVESAAVEAAAKVRWVRSEDKYATVAWDDAPAFVREAYLETALLQLRAAQAAVAPGWEELRRVVEAYVSSERREGWVDSPRDIVLAAIDRVRAVGVGDV